MFTLEQLRYLSAIARFNSVTLAAEEFSVTPSAVSTAIKKLEKTANVSLVNRSSHGIKLTDTALQIVQIIDELLERVSEIEDILTKYDNVNIETPLTVYSSRGITDGAAKTLFSYFDSINVPVIISDISVGNETFLDFISKDPNAILINYFAEPVCELLNEFSNIAYLKINSSPPCIICSKEFSTIPSDITEISIHEALKLPFLMYNEGYDLALKIFEMLEEHGTVHFIQKSSNLSMNNVMMARGMGVSVAPANFLTDSIGPGAMSNTLRVIPIKCDLRLTLMLCYNRNATPEHKQLFQKIAKDLQ